MPSHPTLTDTVTVPPAVRKRLPDGALSSLDAALARLADWTCPLPPRSHFYINERIVLHSRSSIPDRARYGDVVRADVLFDIHSLLAAHCLLKSWRTAQLAEGLRSALATWNLTVAAAVTRSLIETASSWALDSREIETEWKKAKQRPVHSESDALRVRDALYKTSLQMAWGTRLPFLTAKSPALKRVNILTLIQKAERLLATPGLMEEYEILCDAVHQSWGAAECFWLEAGRAPGLPKLRVLISKDAVGQVDASDSDPIRPGSPLSRIVMSTGAWAMETLLADLRRFDTVCRDLSLTARRHLLSNLDYWGIAKPTGAYEPCACSSGRKTRFCPHEFGRV